MYLYCRKIEAQVLNCLALLNNFAFIISVLALRLTIIIFYLNNTTTTIIIKITCTCLIKGIVFGNVPPSPAAAASWPGSWNIVVL